VAAKILRGEIRWADLNPVKGKEQAGLGNHFVNLYSNCFHRRPGF
jgi:mRNA interferase MazF